MSKILQDLKSAKLYMSLHIHTQFRRNFFWCTDLWPWTSFRARASQLQCMKLDGINISLLQLRAVTVSLFHKENQEYLMHYWSELSSTGRSKISFLTNLRVSDTSVSLVLYPMTHLPGENSEINLCKVSWNPQCFLKETKNPLSCSQESKKKKKNTQTQHSEPSCMI